jgi:class 3 adenylate cyclase/tetratricopeptide (TPR) repeat protein
MLSDERALESAGLIEHHLPSELKERGLSQKQGIEGEKRQVTVLFCDMVGFTSLTERIGAEQAYAMMEQLYEILIQKVYDFDGTVNELTGDGVLALFGAPIALEDAPQRAVRSALAIHREIAKFNETTKVKLRQLPPLRMRIGIHTGPVVVGTLGNDLRIEFKAVGDTVNIASRVQELAEPGSILVTEETIRRVEGFFRFEALGDKQLKGRVEPIGVYRIVAPSSSRTRFDVSAEKGLTPFVGRDRELELLLDGYERARGGRGQAISIVAEAGLGKSRLLYEFRKLISAEDVMFLEGTCVSYCRGLTYYPLIDLLRSSFSLLEGDSKTEVEAKLGPALKRLGVVRSTSLPVLAALLSTSGGSAESSMSPEARKAQLTRALGEVLLATSEQRPLVVAVEDLHWIDSASEELLSHLLSSISGSRVFMLFTYRPEYLHTWGARSYHSQLTLNRLSNREALTMARHQLGGDLEERLQDLVLEKTEGVPFFVEEFLKSLRDLNLLDHTDAGYSLADPIEEISVPTTIQDVLRARVDLLPEAAKELLKTASIVGREMSHQLLQNLVDEPEQELLAGLSILRDAELLYERGLYPRCTYLFKHALTREVVHDSLLFQRRKELHRKAGEVIERVHANNLDEYCGVIADHFIAGQEFDKGAEYSRLAARKAHHSGALADAIAYAKRAVECIQHASENAEAQKREIDARTTLAGYLLNIGRPHEAKDAVASIMDRAIELDHRSSWPAIFGATGISELFREDYAAAMQHLEKVLADPDEKAAVWRWTIAYYLGIFHFWRCEFDRADGFLKTTISMSQAAGHLEGVAIGRATTAIRYLGEGRIDRAMKEWEKARAASKESQDPTALALDQAVVGILRSAQGLHAEAQEHLLRGLKYTGEAAQSTWRSMVLTYLGDTLGELGDYGEAESRYLQAAKILEEEGALCSWRAVHELKAARARAQDGDTDIDMEQLRRWHERNQFRLLDGLIARNIAQILLLAAEPRIPEARKWLERAIASDAANGARLDLAKDHACSAELHRLAGEPERMRENLTRARDLFQKCGADGFAQEMDRRITGAALASS